MTSAPLPVIRLWNHGARRRSVFFLLAAATVAVPVDPSPAEIVFTPGVPEVTTAPSPDILSYPSLGTVRNVRMVRASNAPVRQAAILTAAVESQSIAAYPTHTVIKRVSIARSSVTPGVRFLMMSAAFDPLEVFPPTVTMEMAPIAPTISVFNPIPCALSDDGKWPPPVDFPKQWSTVPLFLDQTPESVSPPALSMVMTPVVPTVAVSSNTLIAAVPASLRMTAYAPTIEVFGNPNIRPPTVLMRMSPVAPAVVDSPPIIVPDKIGGDDAYHHVVYEKQNTGRAKLKLKKDREITREIAEIYRQLTEEPATARAAETIVAPVVVPLEADDAPVNAPPTRELPPIERQAEVLRVKADRGEPEAVDAEIALRLLHKQWLEAQENDDQAALELLLRFLI